MACSNDDKLHPGRECLLSQLGSIRIEPIPLLPYMSEYKFLSHLKQVKASMVGMKRKEEDTNRNNLQYQIAIDHGLKSERGE